MLGLTAVLSVRADRAATSGPGRRMTLMLTQNVGDVADQG
jgi:hypothetical protein